MFIGPLSVSLVYDSRPALFLMQLKEAIACRRYLVTQREKNNEFLARHGMTPGEREEVLLGLQVSDYVSGPAEESDCLCETGVWGFKTKYQGIDIHIRVSLLSVEGFFARDGQYAKDGYYAKCSAFHD